MNINLKFSKRKLALVVILLLLITVSISQYSEVKSLESKILYQYEYIPSIDLSNTSFEYNDQFYASVTGFVKFNKISDQPKQARQYYKIEPVYKLDDDFMQIYTLTETIKLNYLPPTEISEPTELNVKMENENILILEDKSGNTYSIVKYADHVFMNDSTLLTSNSDYQDFMKILLK